MLCCFLSPLGATGKGGVISVNYDDFISDVTVGDELLVDGGIISFVVTGKTESDVEVSSRWINSSFWLALQALM